MNAVVSGAQHDVAGRCVILPSKGHIQQVLVLGIRMLQKGRPPRIGQQRVLVVLGPVDQVVAARQPDASTLVQPVPAPVAEASAL